MTTTKHTISPNYPNGKEETRKMFEYAAKIREEEAAKKAAKVADNGRPNSEKYYGVKYTGEFYFGDRVTFTLESGQVVTGEITKVRAPSSNNLYPFVVTGDDGTAWNVFTHKLHHVRN